MDLVIVQKLKKEVETDIDRAIKYYSILSAVNDFKLTRREIQLLAFTSVRGTITPLSARKEFIQLFGSSLNSIENFKGLLKEKGFLILKDGKYRVNPIITLDFSKELVLRISLNTKPKENGPDIIAG